MKRVVNFYEKLPRGPAPEVKATGLLGRYQAKHFGKNPSAKRESCRNMSPHKRSGLWDADNAPGTQLSSTRWSSSSPLDTPRTTTSTCVSLPRDAEMVATLTRNSPGHHKNNAH